MISNLFRKLATWLSIFFVNKTVDISKDYKIYKKIRNQIFENKMNNINLKKLIKFLITNSICY